MNEIVKLYNEHPVRIVDIEGNPWFVAKDVCEVLGLDAASGARGLPDDEKGLHTMQTPGGMQRIQIVSEPGLYRLIFRSRKAEAECFKRWVCHDVLPSIRRDGAYVSQSATQEQLRKVANYALARIMAERELRMRAEDEAGWLRQFLPSAEYGSPSPANGLPRWQYRRGSYVSRNGRSPLRPEVRQPDLFRDWEPYCEDCREIGGIFGCPELNA